MHIANRILFAAGIVLALALLAGGALLLFVDADRFRPRIERAVSEATGSEFRLREPLEVGLWPRLAVRMGAGEIGGAVRAAPRASGSSAASEARGAAAELAPLARWRSIHLGARLLPLLRGRLIVDRVRIEGLVLELRRDAAGRGNWEFLLAERGRGAESRIVLEQLEGLELRNGAVRYVDGREDAGMLRDVRIDEWRLDFGLWRPGDPLELSTRFALALPASAERAVITLDARVQPGGEVHELRIPAWSAAIGDSRLRGAAVVRIPAGDAPASEARASDQSAHALRGEGTIAAESPSLRLLLAAAGIEAPATRDAHVLGALRLTSDWRLADEALVVEPLSLQLDETNLSGRIETSFAEAGISEFSLNGDHIDLTRYLEPEEAAGEPFEFPAAKLKALRLRGELKFAEARLADVQMKGVRLELEEGRLRAGAPP